MTEITNIKSIVKVAQQMKKHKFYLNIYQKEKVPNVSSLYFLVVNMNIMCVILCHKLPISLNIDKMTIIMQEMQCIYISVSSI